MKEEGKDPKGLILKACHVRKAQSGTELKFPK